MDDDAHTAWLDALRLQVDTRDGAQAWRQRRTSFAVALGQHLTDPIPGKVEISSSQPVVYGVWLSWGVLYIGQTLNGRRRLRDLPIGESHHLSNTFPPEVWAKVGVVAWQFLPGGQEAADELGAALVGKCLEYLLQRDRNPLVNAAKRNRVGDFMPVDHSRSRSIAALRSERLRISTPRSAPDGTKSTLRSTRQHRWTLPFGSSSPVLEPAMAELSAIGPTIRLLARQSPRTRRCTHSQCSSSRPTSSSACSPAR